MWKNVSKDLQSSLNPRYAQRIRVNKSSLLTGWDLSFCLGWDQEILIRSRHQSGRHISWRTAAGRRRKNESQSKPTKETIKYTFSAIYWFQTIVCTTLRSTCLAQPPPHSCQVATEWKPVFPKRETSKYTQFWDALVSDKCVYNFLKQNVWHNLRHTTARWPQNVSLSKPKTETSKYTTF